MEKTKPLHDVEIKYLRRQTRRAVAKTLAANFMSRFCFDGKKAKRLKESIQINLASWLEYARWFNLQKAIEEYDLWQDDIES